MMFFCLKTSLNPPIGFRPEGVSAANNIRLRIISLRFNAVIHGGKKKKNQFLGLYVCKTVPPTQPGGGTAGGSAGRVKGAVPLAAVAGTLFPHCSVGMWGRIALGDGNYGGFRHSATVSCPVKSGGGRGRTRGALFSCNKVLATSALLMIPGCGKGKPLLFSFSFALGLFPKPRVWGEPDWERRFPVPPVPARRSFQLGAHNFSSVWGKKRNAGRG